jgi:hypothetical protein
MGEKKGWGRTVMGWIIVDDHAKGEAARAPTGDSVEDLLARYSGDPGAPPAPAPMPVQLQGDVPRAQGGKLELGRIFAAASISPEEQGRVVKAQELLRTLPTETPLPVKKQIVEASLKAFGYPIDDLIEAGVQEIQALEAYIQREAQESQRTLADATQRIEALTKEISDLKQLMQSTIDEQAAAAAACNQAKLQIQEVLEFFGQEAVARVVQASPKLHEPPK